MRPEPDLQEVADNAEYALSLAMETESRTQHHDMLGEALGIIHRIMSDLVPHQYADEYAADLSRLDQIAHLVR